MDSVTRGAETFRSCPYEIFDGYRAIIAIQSLAKPMIRTWDLLNYAALILAVASMWCLALFH